MSKKVRRLSDEEQLQLRNSAKEELIRLKCVFDEKEICTLKLFLYIKSFFIYYNINRTRHAYDYIL
jgi:hypothetical protein